MQKINLGYRNHNLSSLFCLMGCALGMILFLLCFSPNVYAQADLFMRDTPTDEGDEPNLDDVPMWISGDIWVRRTADPNYSPYPFGAINPPLWTTIFHKDNPEFRDSELSRPNYVYVRVTNRGDQPSDGTERLRVYWAKASTGLAWPKQWEDYPGWEYTKIFDNGYCAEIVLYGEEITKTRKNLATLTYQERLTLLSAIVSLDAGGGYPHLGSGWNERDPVSGWDKQDEIHQATHVHDGPAFLPWHRELNNRFENLLRKKVLGIKLHYWDWTTDPTHIRLPGTAEVYLNLFDAGFMGSASGPAGPPFAGRLDNNGRFTGSREQTGNPADPPQQITRAMAEGPPSVPSDLTIVNSANMAEEKDQYHDMRISSKESGHLGEPEHPNSLENAHDKIHKYIGGTIGATHKSYQDPFVYLFHSNLDRLWAMWQTDSMHTWRLIPNRVYGKETSYMCITEYLDPWAGCKLPRCDPGNPTPLPKCTEVRPWAPPENLISKKNSKDPSVVSPPYYDTSPLVIPRLEPGQAVILQIPWYTPDPSLFRCFGEEDQAHVCLLARIETEKKPPFGMTIKEKDDIIYNVRENNNIVWRNVYIQKVGQGAATKAASIVAPTKTAIIIVRNVYDTPTLTKLSFDVPPEELANSFYKYGTIKVNLDDTLFQKWTDGGRIGEGIVAVGGTLISLLGPNAWIGNINLDPNEGRIIGVISKLFLESPGKIIKNLDVKQYATVQNNDILIGGARLAMDLSPSIPIFSQWGLIIFGFLLLVYLTYFLYRKRKLSTPTAFGILLLVFTIAFFISYTT